MPRIATRLLIVTSLVLLTPGAPIAARDAAPWPVDAPQAGGGRALGSILSRATDYVSRSLQTLSAVVCEEHHVQRLERRDVSPMYGYVSGLAIQVTERTLVSDYLLVQLPGAAGWLPFRDVYAVDGKPVRDRSDRLARLFIEPHADRLKQAELIRVESSRYNIGVDRDTNVPTFALQFLLPDVRSRFTFRTRGRETVDGSECDVVEYEETARPTMIRSASGEDVPAAGQFWIEDPTGVVIRSRIDTRLGDQKRRIDVTFGRDSNLGLAVPIAMDERYTGPLETLTSRATYSNFRRFQVLTTEEIKKRP